MTKKRKSKRKRSLLNSASSPTLLRTKENQRAIQRKVREMAASGLVEDQIALRIGTDKNQLRRRYIDQIKDGRANAAAEAQSAAGEELSADEETMRRALYAGFGNPDYMIGDLNILQNATLEQTNAVWNEWLRRARGGARTTPLIIENELFPNKT